MRDLTQEKLKQLFSYDSETGLLCYREDCLRIAGREAGSNNVEGYRRVRIGGRSYLTHRLIWLYVYGQWPAEYIDHINRVRDDNRLCNLRQVSKYENSHNVSLNTRNISGCLGVTWDKRHRSWLVRIGADGKSNVIGRFADLQAAIAARRLAEQKYHPSKPNQGHQHDAHSGRGA